MPRVPVLPILSVLACFYLMLNLPGETWIRFVVWMVIGIAVYFGYGRRTAASTPRATGRTPPPRTRPAAPDALTPAGEIPADASAGARTGRADR